MYPSSRHIFLLALVALFALMACDEQDPPILLGSTGGDTNQEQATNDAGEPIGGQDAGVESDTESGTPNNQSPNDDPNVDPNDDPGQDPNQEPSDKAFDGEPCSDDNDCQGGTCMTGDDWPNGYCTTMDCETYVDCANESDENACLQSPQGGSNYCVRLCSTSDTDACREDYQCQSLSSAGEGYCSGDAGTPGGPTEEVPFEIECHPVSGTVAEIEYDIDSNTESYMVVPISGNGQAINPLDITTPSGQTIDFQGPNYFQAIGAQLFGSVNPTVVPAVPQFADQFETGSHVYRVGTHDSEMCHYVIESPGNPTVIDLNIYLVGLSMGGGNANIQAIIDQAEVIYEQAGISFGNVRFPDIAPEAEQNFSVIQSEADIRSLASYSTDPEEDGASPLSANVFITQQFALAGALGLSLGIPGVAGLHGSAISGVAMTGEYIGSMQGNRLTANVLAHELGHFLGLFHTTEQGGQGSDPLNDTPECTNFQNPTNCPDWGNLMFPSADLNNTELTNDQSFVLGANPLTK